MMLSGAPVRIKLRTRIPLKFHCNRRPLESCRRQTTYQNGPRRSGAPMSGLCSIQKTAKAKRRSPGRLPTFRPGLLFLRRHGNAPRRAASRTPPRRGRRASKKVALREHHPRRDPHQHDHDGRNQRSPVAAGVLPNVFFTTTE